MSEIPEHIMTDSGEFHEFTTGELVRWLQAKYRRHGEVEDGIAAERLKSLSAEVSALESQLDDYLSHHEAHHLDCEIAAYEAAKVSGTELPK